MITRDCGEVEGTDHARRHKVTIIGDPNILYISMI